MEVFQFFQQGTTDVLLLWLKLDVSYLARFATTHSHKLYYFFKIYNHFKQKTYIVYQIFLFKIWDLSTLEGEKSYKETCARFMNPIYDQCYRYMLSHIGSRTLSEYFLLC